MRLPISQLTRGDPLRGRLDFCAACGSGCTSAAWCCHLGVSLIQLPFRQMHSSTSSTMLEMCSWSMVWLVDIYTVANNQHEAWQQCMLKI